MISRGLSTPPHHCTTTPHQKWTRIASKRTQNLGSDEIPGPGTGKGQGLHPIHDHG